MQVKEEVVIPADVGVIIGRFQVHNLHHAHLDLIRTVTERHDKVILFIGLSPLKATKNNPLDFESRKKMIESQFPNVLIVYIKDCKDDKVWSKRIDTQIKDLIGANHSVVLYGSRDSFIKYYTGCFKTMELVPESFISGSELRKDISRTIMNTPEFRAGAIWATQQSYSVCYPTVDIAIVDENCEKVLLARKPDESEFRFIGGFATPNSSCFEEDARREVQEETGIEITDPIYIGSFKIDDWRYKSEESKIKTLFFVAKYFSGRPEADDDICEVKWFTINQLKPENIVKEHRELLNKFLNVNVKEVVK